MKASPVGKIAVIAAIPLALVWALIDEASKTTQYESSAMNIGAFMGNFTAKIVILMLVAILIAYLTRVKKDGSTPTKPEPDKKVPKATTDSSDAEALEAKTSIIKLGFKSINHITLTDKNMYDLPDKELERYYKAGERAMKGKQ